MCAAPSWDPSFLDRWSRNAISENLGECTVSNTQQQQPRQAGGNRGKKQKAAQQGQTGARSAYRSPIDELKDQVFSVGNTAFKNNVDAIADYAQVHMGITADVASAFRDGRAVVIPAPARPTVSNTQQQQPRQAGGNRGKKQKAAQQGQTGARSAYRSPIDELKDQVFSVGNTAFKNNVDAIADYAQVHMGITADVASAFRDGRAVVIPAPARPTPAAAGESIDEFEMIEHKMKFGDYMKEEKKARTSLQSLFPLLLGQCDDYLRGRIKNRSTFQQLLSSSDTIGLLRAIEEEGHSVNNHEFPYINVIKGLNRISRLRSDKGGGHSTGEHLDALDAACDLLDRSAGTLPLPSPLPARHIASPTLRKWGSNAIRTWLHWPTLMRQAAKYMSTVVAPRWTALPASRSQNG